MYAGKFWYIQLYLKSWALYFMILRDLWLIFELWTTSCFTFIVHLHMGLLPCERVSSWWTQNCSLESITFVFVERISARAIRPLLPLLSPYDLFLVSDSRFCLKASPIVKTECLGQATGDIWFSLWGWKASIRLFFPVFCTSGERRIGWAEPLVSWSPLIHVVLLYAPWVWIHCSEIETSWHVIVINL